MQLEVSLNKHIQMANYYELFNYDNALQDVCKLGYKEYIDFYINLGANVAFGVWGACEGGYIEIVKLLIEKLEKLEKEVIELYKNGYTKDGYTKFTKIVGEYLYLNIGLNYAVEGGHIDIVKFIIEKGAKLELYRACKRGNMNIVNLMIEKGTNDWNGGLYGACKGGHIELVNLMIKKGANDWNGGLWEACKGGHIDIVNLIIEKGANNWNGGLKGGCEGGHLEIVNLMIEKGANNWDEGLYMGCVRGHIDIVNLIIKKMHKRRFTFFKSQIKINWDFISILCPPLHACVNAYSLLLNLACKRNINWNLILGFACNIRNIDILKLAINKGANDWNSGLQYACKGGHIDIVNFMIQKGANNWNKGLEGACKGGHLEIVNLMIEKGANDLNIGLECACKGGNLDILNIILQNGAKYEMQPIYINKHIDINNISSHPCFNIIIKHTEEYKTRIYNSNNSNNTLFYTNVFSIEDRPIRYAN